MKKGTTDYLISLDNVCYNGDFLNTITDDVTEKYIIYGYIEDINGELNKWENPHKLGGGDETCVVKVGMVHPHSEYAKGKAVKDAVNIRNQQDHSDSGRTDYVPVFCFPSDKTDREVREFLYRKCLKQAFDRKVDGENVRGLSKKNIKEYYNYLVNGIKRSENYGMSNAQRDAYNKMVNFFKNSTESTSYFLLASKPRFGKNFTMLQFVKEMGIKNSLFISYLPSVFDSLESDVENHIDFEGWRYVKYRDNRDFEDSDATTIISSSAQLLNYVEDNLNGEFSIDDMNIFRESLNGIKNHNIELLVIDEAHFGGQTNNLENIISEIAPKYVIFVTGTASKYTNDERFGADNTYEYDYIDECNDTDVRAKQMPRIKIYTYEIDKALADAVRNQYKIEEYFSFSKLFLTENGKFKNKANVENFVKAVFGKRDDLSDIRNTMKLNNMSPFSCDEFDGKINHSLVIMPSVASVKALIPIVKKYFGDEFVFFNASGLDGITSIDEIKRGIQSAKANGKKTMTFVCDRFREGVTVSNWSAVFFFEDGHSYDRYIQTLFRAQSANENKPYCYIFDYNPERCLTIRYEHINYNAKKGYSSEEMAKVLLDCMPIVYYDHKGNLIEGDEFESRLEEYGHRLLGKGFSRISSSMINMNLVSANRDYLMSILEDIKTSSKMSEDVIEGMTNGFRGGKIYEAVRKTASVHNTDNSEKEIKKEYDNLVKLCLEVIKHLPEYWYLEEKKYKNVMDSLNGNAELFAEIVGVEMNEFKSLLVKNFFDVERLDEMMREFYKDRDEDDIASAYISEVNSMDTLAEIFDSFRNKWICETEDRMKDVPYAVAKEFINSFVVA